MKTVTKVTMTVFCHPDDSQEVKDSLDKWFCENDCPLTRSKGGIILSQRPLRKSEKWMIDTLYSQDVEISA